MPDGQDILDRLQELTGFTDQDRRILQEAAPAVQSWLPDLAEQLLARLAKIPARRPLPVPPATVILAWLGELVRGDPAPAFWTQCLRVGQAMAEYRVHPADLLAIQGWLLATLAGQCQQIFEEDSAAAPSAALGKMLHRAGGYMLEGMHDHETTALARAGLREALVDRLIEVAGRAPT